jgi:hypothetical protein
MRNPFRKKKVHRDESRCSNRSRRGEINKVVDKYPNYRRKSLKKARQTAA